MILHLKRRCKSLSVREQEKASNSISNSNGVNRRWSVALSITITSYHYWFVPRWQRTGETVSEYRCVGVSVWATLGAHLAL
jgi:hypothetical protein